MRLRILGVWVILLALCAAAFGQKPTAVSGPQEPFNQPQYAATGNHPETAAYYYAWYVQNQWACLLDMVPGLGQYDSRLNSVINNHMLWANQAGLDDLILSWWGTSTTQGQRVDNLVPTLLNAASQQGIRMPIMIDEYAGRTPASVAKDIGYLINAYSSLPGWYTNTRPTPYLPNSNPKPVFLLFFSGSDVVSPASWKSTIDSIHAKYGAVVLVHNDYDPSWVTAGDFDGMFGYGTYATFNERELAQQLPTGAWYIPTCYPGFNAYRSKGWTGIVGRNSGQTYNQTWFSALDLGNDMPMVAVTSFNEWTESTQIEPCGSGFDSTGFNYENYGSLGSFGYINLTANWTATTHNFQPLTYSGAQTVWEQPGQVNNTDNGLWQNSWGSIGQCQNTLVDGEPAVSVGQGSNFIYYQVARTYAPSNLAPCTIRVDYFDSGTDKFRLDYRTTGDAGYSTPYVTMTNTGEWMTATFTIPNILFQALLGGNDDFRISVPENSPDAFGLVAVSLAAPVSAKKRP
jgi:Glycosyl hydrolase family 99